MVAVNRRQFLGGAGLMVGAGALAALTGCSPSEPASVQASTQGDGESVLSSAARAEVEFKSIEVQDGIEELNYDVVVVGGGTSGCCASLASAQGGAKTVMIEKTDMTGGLSSVSVHISAAGAQIQKEAGRNHSSDDLFAIVRDWYHGTNNLSLVREILNNSGETIDWLIENGVGLTVWPNEVVLQPLLDRIREQSATALPDDKLQALVTAFTGEWNGEVMTSTRVIKLLLGEDELSVAGVIAERSDGSQVKINARAVILSAGSWSGETDYFKSILAHTDKYMIHSGTGVSVDNTGDGIYLAEQIGGWRWISCPFWHQIDFADLDGAPNVEMTNRYDFPSLRYDPNLIWVNAEGTRFADEGVAGSFAQRGAVASCQGGDLWVIFDQGVLDDIQKNGSKASVTSDQYRIPSGDEYLQKVADSVEAGEIYKVDTLEELAERCGFLTEEFVQNIEDYNASVDAGYDAYYLKDPKFLTYKFENPPYYAQRMVANNEGGAIGGVRVNRELRVYNRDLGHAFTNLFATGLNASGYFGLGTYIDLAGQTMCFAVNSGRLAGEHAAKLVK